MPNLGPAELIVILIVALVVFGPRKLPELGKSLGAGLREFRRSTSGLREELEGSLKESPAPAGPAAVRTIHAADVQPVSAQSVSAQSVSTQPVPAQPVSPQAVTPSAVTPAAVTPPVALGKDTDSSPS